MFRAKRTRPGFEIHAATDEKAGRVEEAMEAFDERLNKAGETEGFAVFVRNGDGWVPLPPSPSGAFASMILAASCAEASGGVFGAFAVDEAGAPVRPMMIFGKPGDVVASYLLDAGPEFACLAAGAANSVTLNATSMVAALGMTAPGTETEH